MTTGDPMYPAGEMEPIDLVLQRLFSNGKFAQRTQVAELAGCWSEIVGRDMALHCTPEKISDGKLYVKVDSPIWHQQLDMLKEDVLEKVARRMQDLRLTKIICKACGS